MSMVSAKTIFILIVASVCVYLGISVYSAITALLGTL